MCLQPTLTPGKGQLLLLQSASSIFEHKPFQDHMKMQKSSLEEFESEVARKHHMNFLAQHSNLSKSVLWTPDTTHVASLYSAADVYVINSQGVGETFGRVTIEAMAFGLPVLGTNAGGTEEIVEHNVTGLHHPIGRAGNDVLTQNLRFLLENQLAREQMGVHGRKKVQKMYLKQHMYSKFVHVLVSCMRSK